MGISGHDAEDTFLSTGLSLVLLTGLSTVFL